ncbi:hypothetical protein I6N90_01380 [Paenibacillus sp. GSMTC-2017]|uniref:hypothetical protein n=1 Tax=Paenibacillus sp. GSMTC-2017 TaxID=2794350 RepID=UPI0018D616DB|nr:hypothetical protein [Paenibacillus sp. GSMTC-2017]MBH5316456.1 hypothetical protein [Paenibacillus sp. GSMTC-2017]
MANITIIDASMTYSKEDGYVGKVQFSVEGHDQEYEIALHSKRGSDWGYGLFFLNESGSEEQFLALDNELEEDDELFEVLIHAAQEKLVRQEEE